MEGDDPWGYFNEDKLVAVLDSYSNVDLQSNVSSTNHTTLADDHQHGNEERNKSVIVDIKPCPMVI